MCLKNLIVLDINCREKEFDITFLDLGQEQILADRE